MKTTLLTTVRLLHEKVRWVPKYMYKAQVCICSFLTLSPCYFAISHPQKARKTVSVNVCDVMKDAILPASWETEHPLLVRFRGSSSPLARTWPRCRKWPKWIVCPNCPRTASRPTSALISRLQRQKRNELSASYCIGGKMDMFSRNPHFIYMCGENTFTLHFSHLQPASQSKDFATDANSKVK